MAITHEEALPTFDQTHRIYGKQNGTVSQATEGPLTDSGATSTVTQTVTPERQASTPASGSPVQGWITTGSTIPEGYYEQRNSLPVQVGAQAE